MKGTNEPKQSKQGYKIHHKNVKHNKHQSPQSKLTSMNSNRKQREEDAAARFKSQQQARDRLLCSVTTKICSPCSSSIKQHQHDKAAFQGTPPQLNKPARVCSGADRSAISTAALDNRRLVLAGYIHGVSVHILHSTLEREGGAPLRIEAMALPVSPAL